jgi:CHAT domain-containing protein/tetratricopeptide (TPR) repeat protein
MRRYRAVSSPKTHMDQSRESRLVLAASDALAMASIDPDRASALAHGVLEQAEEAGDVLAASVAERALGGVAQERHNLIESQAHLRRAIHLADAGGFLEAAAEARMALMGTLAHSGDYPGALREGDLAMGVLHGVARARAEMVRAKNYAQQGRVDEAVQGFRRALPVLRRAGDRLFEACAYEGRAMTHYLRGAFTASESDLRRAEALLVDLGETRRAAGTRVHLAMAVALRGDIPEALAWFDRANELNVSAEADAMVLIDRSEVLLRARLTSEARVAAEMAVQKLTEEGEAAYVAIALLKLAESALAQGDFGTAGRVAEQARRAFTRQERTSWATLARHVALQAAWMSGGRSPALLASARRTANELASAGVTLASLDARLVAARIALDLGRQRIARRELDVARRARNRGPVQLRVRAWHAEALLRQADGDRRGTESALLAGVRLLERYRATLGATDLRAHASGHTADLAAMGVGLAIEEGRAERALTWMERCRAGSLRLRPARPPDDSRLAAGLNKLRAVATKIEAAAMAGKPTAELEATQAELEEVVRRRARHATGILAASLEPPPDASAIKRAAANHALIEIVDHDGVLHAVVVSSGRAVLRRLAATIDVASELDGLGFALRRLAFGRGSAASLEAAREAVVFGGKRLDALLLDPVAADIGDRTLVVIPTGRLHAVPWSVLPSCTGRCVSVAPSAGLWLRATQRANGAGDGRVVLVAGPHLDHASSEVAALARGYPDALRLTGRGATCEAVSAALDGASLAHVAAHGRFRADNPLFSCLHLVDGPLTVYDLECLGQAPTILVLSACESGLTDVQVGDELMGLASAVFALGTATLIASLFPVPDVATRRLMLALHAGLRSGLSASAALARAQRRLAGSGPTGMAAAAAFVCFGSDSGLEEDLARTGSSARR